jgi:uncharacterized protein (TIGR02147 family)
MVRLAPDLKKYTGYREYLRDFYLFRKSQRSGFSYRLFSKKAGIKSPNYLQLVIQGKRNLSPQAAAKVAVVVGLKGPEKEYFVGLVKREAARYPDERSQAEKHLLIAMRKIISRDIPQAQSEVLSHWYHLVVRELFFLRDFDASPTWISKKMRGLITGEEADSSLLVLLKGGFIEKDRHGNYQVKNPVIDTGDAFGTARILKMHSDTLQVWRSLLAEIPAEERELGLLNIPIREECIGELKAKIRAFQDEIIGWAEGQVAPDQVVQLGTYLIPISSGAAEKNFPPSL